MCNDVQHVRFELASRCETVSIVIIFSLGTRLGELPSL